MLFAAALVVAASVSAQGTNDQKVNTNQATQPAVSPAHPNMTPAHPNQNVHQDIKHDREQIKNEKTELKHDQAERHQAKANGNKVVAEKEGEEIREHKAAIMKEKKDSHHDRQAIHHAQHPQHPAHPQHPTK